MTLLTYAKDGRDIPPAGVVAKIAFIEAFRTSGKTRVELARRLDKNESEIRRMFDPYHRTKLGALEDAMKVLGKRFILSVRDEPAIKDAAA